MDVEAEACRRLRTEIAGQAARLRVLQAQARRLHGAAQRHGSGRLARPRGGATSAELTTLAASYRDLAEATERELAELAAAKWASLLAAPAAAGVSEAKPTASDGVNQIQDTAKSAHPGVEQLSRADQLIATDLGRCDTEDVGELYRLRGEVSSAGTVRQARIAVAELEIAIADSVRRRRHAAEVEQIRASLVALAEDALPEERAGLIARVEDAPDPGGLSAAVAQAAARADLVRARDAVLAATADALREIGCEVGEDFATLLAGQSEAIVAFGTDQNAGYGLLVRLPPDSGRVMTALVKRDGIGGADADKAAQQQFCDSGLPVWTSRLRDDGVVLADEQRMEPGLLPVAPIPADRWPSPARTSRQTAARKPRSTARPAAARERRHGR